MRKCVGLRWMTFDSESAYKKFIAKKKQVELEKEMWGKVNNEINSMMLYCKTEHLGLCCELERHGVLYGRITKNQFARFEAIMSELKQSNCRSKEAAPCNLDDYEDSDLCGFDGHGF